MKTFTTRIITKAVSLFAAIALFSTVASAGPLIIINSASWHSPLGQKIRLNVNSTTVSFYGISGVKLYWRKQTPAGSWNATGIAGSISPSNSQDFIYDISSVPASMFPIEVILGTSPTNTAGNIGSSSNIKVIGPHVVQATAMSRH